MDVKKKERLWKNFATKLEKTVVRTRKSIALELGTASERKIIH